MSHKIVLSETKLSGETGIDSIQYNNGGVDKARITFTSSGDIAFHTSTKENVLFIKNNGNIGIGTTDPQANLHIKGSAKLESMVATDFTSAGTSSDRRLKKNIKKIKKFNLDELRPVQYNYKSRDDERVFFGFVAQEIKESYPHMVFENNDGMYSLDYTQFIPISIKNLQDQEKSITKLQNRIKTMKEKLKQLKRFTDLEYLPLTAFSTDDKSE